MRETGKDKIQKICDVLRNETLEPVKQEAREIIENAHIHAAEIVREASERAEAREKALTQEIGEKNRAFKSSLHLAGRQGIEMIKQKIEKELFNRELSSLVAQEMREPKLIAHLIESFVKSLENHGIDEDFEAIIPKEISPRAINSLLTQNILQRLEGESVTVGDFHGGVKISMKERKVTIDISENVVRELIAGYIRRDFRELIFQD